MTTDRALVTTGASTGIGEACVRRFDRPGWRVYATARREEDALCLRQRTSERVTPIFLDVADGESIQALGISLAADRLHT